MKFIIRAVKEKGFTYYTGLRDVSAGRENVCDLSSIMKDNCLGSILFDVKGRYITYHEVRPEEEFPCL